MEGVSLLQVVSKLSLYLCAHFLLPLEGTVMYQLGVSYIMLIR